MLFITSRLTTTPTTIIMTYTIIMDRSQLHYHAYCIMLYIYVHITVSSIVASTAQAPAQLFGHLGRSLASGDKLGRSLGTKPINSIGPIVSFPDVSVLYLEKETLLALMAN